MHNAGLITVFDGEIILLESQGKYKIRAVNIHIHNLYF